MNDIKVKDVMTHLIVTLRQQDTIQEAARRLLSNRISGAPVVEQGRLVGIVSELDLMAAYEGPARIRSNFVAAAPMTLLLRGSMPHHAQATTVGDVMTKDVLTVSPEATLWEAAGPIDRHGIRRLPVVDGEGYVVGVLARADLVRTMARSDEDVTAAVRSAIEVLGEESFDLLDVTTSEGKATVRGTVDRKSTHDIAIRIASRVPGVLELTDHLEWGWDDTNVKAVRSHLAPDAARRDPWRPRVKERMG